jgi:hypothetical protein
MPIDSSSVNESSTVTFLSAQSPQSFASPSYACAIICAPWPRCLGDEPLRRRRCDGPAGSRQGPPGSQERAPRKGPRRVPNKMIHTVLTLSTWSSTV